VPGKRQARDIGGPTMWRNPSVAATAGNPV